MPPANDFMCNWPCEVQKDCAGILYTNCPLLNYLILIAKVYLWGCRRNQTLPGITAFSSQGNYDAEKSTCVKTNKMDNGPGGGDVLGFQLMGMIDLDD